jgi:lipoate synthase
LKSRPPSGQQFTEIKSTLREHDLHTVCEEANCPNLGECWSGEGGSGDGGTATFMLMGDRCSRGCNFCDVETGGMEALDPDEPANVADAVAEIGLDYVVLTSVDRDDLEDGGSRHFAETIREIKRRDPEILVEVLIPDFGGDPAAVERIVDAGPDVIAHNVETVERLQWPVRDRRAGYQQTLDVLEQVDRTADIRTKTSIMLGLGEYDHEVYRTLRTFTRTSSTRGRRSPRRSWGSSTVPRGRWSGRRTRPASSLSRHCSARGSPSRRRERPPARATEPGNDPRFDDVFGSGLVFGSSPIHTLRLLFDFKRKQNHP